MALRSTLLSVLLFGSPGALVAQAGAPSTGPVIGTAGAVYEVPGPDFATPLDMTYRVAFDVAEGAESPEALNRQLNSVARFLNMHVRAGVPLERLDLAVVVHGAAGAALLDRDTYRARLGVDNPNADLIEALATAGVRIILCGQTAASRNLPADRLLEPVEMALSAMTALAALQEWGYHVNPF